MSLLSIRNLAAPFSNGVHLATILLVSLLFGIFRWADGGLRVVAKNGIRNRGVVQERPAVPQGVKPPAALQPEKFSEDDVLRELIGNKNKNGAAAKPNTPSSPAATKGESELEAIERSLGLR